MFKMGNKGNAGKNSNENSQGVDDTQTSLKLTYKIEDNISVFKQIFKNDQTIKYRKLEIDYDGIVECCIIFIDFMVKFESVIQDIIRPLMSTPIKDEIKCKNAIEYIENRIINSGEISRTSDLDKITTNLISGNALLLVDGSQETLCIDAVGYNTRSITEPESEAVIRGPREGFIESLVINLSLIRRRIKTPALKFKFKKIGLRTQTTVCICYIEALASQKVIDELDKRLDAIDTDSVLDTGYIEEFIHDSPFSPFETVGNTERPDVVSAKLLEGRVAILCDGSPFALTLPFLFLEYFQASEDYYENFVFATINRIIRIIGFFLTTSTPAIFVALTTFHQELLPTPLIISLSASREGVPLPTIVEAVLMLLVFEILREAGTRLPKTIGQTISIVGALVLGQAAVNAKLVSASMVIVVALTAIAAFLLMKMKAAIIVTRFIFVLMAALLGLYGYIFAVIGLFLHLMSLRSFGYPYMLDIGSINEKDINDTAVRAPWWSMNYRPFLISRKNPMRQGNGKNKGR